MGAFWVIAAALAVGAWLIVLWPLHRRGHLTPTIIVSALCMPLLAGLIYTQLSSWSWEPIPASTATATDTAGAPPVAQMVDSLQSRLVTDPDDVNGWKLLARSYVVLGRYVEARDAIEEAWKRTSDPDNELKLAYAEAHALADRRSLRGKPGELVEEVLAVEPNNPRGLWYGGLAALVNERRDDAKARWSTLLQLNPPAEVATVLREQLAALGADANMVAGQPQVGDNGLTINLRVSLSDQAEPDAAALFVIARDPAGGPPIAVARHGSDGLPGDFVLSDANTMLAGRSLQDFEELEVVARLSKTGQPIAQPGDWFGAGRYRPGDGALNIVINQQVE